MDFGNRLKELRQETDLTLDELKDILRTTKATLSRYENSLRIPKSEFVESCANYFEVSVDYMVGKSDYKGIIESDDIEPILRDTLNKIKSIKKEYSSNSVTEEHLINLIEVAINLAKAEKINKNK